MDQIVLGRVGHYFTPRAGGGACQTAIVVDAAEDVGTEADHHDEVNLAGWNQDGTPFSRTCVRVEQVLAAVDYDHASFHLTRDCPWGR
jgi:hypothetical protein